MILFPYRIEMQQSLGEAAYNKNRHLLSIFEENPPVLQSRRGPFSSEWVLKSTISVHNPHEIIET
jgi:hypothetical protein